MNNRLLIIYNSKTGFTKQYAQWIQEEYPCDLVPYEKRNEIQWDKYDAIIFGSWLHASNLVGFKWFQKQSKDIQDRLIACLVVGVTPNEENAIGEVLRKLFDEQTASRIKTFYVVGGLRYDKMGFINKMMMQMLGLMFKKSYGEDSEQYQRVAKSFEGASKDQIVPLIDYLNKRIS